MYNCVLKHSSLIALIWATSVLAETEINKIKMDYGECQDYQSHKVNLDKTYEIVWNGQAIKDCGVGFYTKGEGLYASDHFKICVDLIDWDMSDCSSQMYLEYNGVKSVSCVDDKPDPFCYDTGVQFVVNVKIPNTTLWKENTTRFTLKIYAKDTTYAGVVSVVIGSVIMFIGTLVLLYKTGCFGLCGGDDENNAV